MFTVLRVPPYLKWGEGIRNINKQVNLPDSSHNAETPEDLQGGPTFCGSRQWTRIDLNPSEPPHYHLPGSYFSASVASRVTLHLYKWDLDWNVAGSRWKLFHLPDKKTIFTGFPFCFLLVLKMLMWCFELQQPSWDHETTNLRTKSLGVWNARGGGRDSFSPWQSHWDRALHQAMPLPHSSTCKKLINFCLFKQLLAGICVTCSPNHF